MTLTRRGFFKRTLMAGVAAPAVAKAITEPAPAIAKAPDFLAASTVNQSARSALADLRSLSVTFTASCSTRVCGFAPLGTGDDRDDEDEGDGRGRIRA